MPPRTMVFAATTSGNGPSWRIQTLHRWRVARFVESRNALLAVTQNSLWKVQGGVDAQALSPGSDLHAASNQLGKFTSLILQAGHSRFAGRPWKRIDAQVRPAARADSSITRSLRPRHWLVSSDGLYSRDMGRHAWEGSTGPGSRSLPSRAQVSALFSGEEPAGAGLEPREARKGEARLEALGAVSRKEPRSVRAASASLRVSRKCVWIMAATVEKKEPFFRQILPGLERQLLRHRRRMAACIFSRWAATGSKRRIWGSERWPHERPPGLSPASFGLARITRARRHLTRKASAWRPYTSGTEAVPPQSAEHPGDGRRRHLDGMTKGVAVSRPGEKAATFESVQGVPLEKITGLGQDSRGRVWVSSAESFKRRLFASTNRPGPRNQGQASATIRFEGSSGTGLGSSEANH